MTWRLTLLAILVAGPAGAQAGDVAVTTVWARASAGPSQTGAVYATVTASQPDRLIGASTPVAETAQLHQDKMQGDVMQMRPVPGGLPVTPGLPIHLAPGGYHLMLMGLKQPLKRGEHFPLTLTFEHAGPVTVQVAVAGPGASQPDMAAMPEMPPK